MLVIIIIMLSMRSQMIYMYNHRDIYVLYDSVISSKKTLQYQAEEGARLDAENKELQFRLAQLKENHTYVLNS